MYPHQLFALHSPYPDGTWRGLEKCSSTKDGLILFDSAEGAEAARVAMGDVGEQFKVVEVTLVTPSVRKPLDSATWDKVNPVVPQPGAATPCGACGQTIPKDGARVYDPIIGFCHEVCPSVGVTLVCRITTCCFACRGAIPEGQSGVFVQGKGIRHEECSS